LDFGFLSGSVVPVVSGETYSEIEIATYGVSGAYRLTESLSLGLGVVRFDGRIQSRTDFITYSGPPFGSGPTTGSETLSANDSDWGVRAGWLWHVSKSWNLGGFYRQAPTFEGRVERQSGAAAVSSADEVVRYPDAFGVGIAFKPGSGALAVSAEWEHVRYSTVTKSFSGDSQLDDGDEVHMGLEYVFLGITPIVALRGGAWFDPEPQVANGAEGSQQSVGRGDLWHGAFGAGFAFSHVQVDLGFDVSETFVTVSLSGVISF
jgi:long-subunit fatty acid transport protein